MAMFDGIFWYGCWYWYIGWPTTDVAGSVFGGGGGTDADGGGSGGNGGAGVAFFDIIDKAAAVDVFR